MHGEHDQTGALAVLRAERGRQPHRIGADTEPATPQPAMRQDRADDAIERRFGQRTALPRKSPALFMPSAAPPAPISKLPE